MKSFFTASKLVVHQAYATVLDSLFPSTTLPTEALGAWKHPKLLSWSGWILLCIVSVLLSIETAEAWRLYQLRLRIEKSLASPASLPKKKTVINTAIDIHKKNDGVESTVTTIVLQQSPKKNVQLTENTLEYQNNASILSWQKLGQELAYDPAILFITLENSLNTDITLLSLHLHENKQHLVLQAEAKNLDAVERWRKDIAKQPLLEASQLIEEKWMPNQNGITPNQFTLDIPLNWNERNEALNSRPPKIMPLQTGIIPNNIQKPTSQQFFRTKTRTIQATHNTLHSLSSAKRRHP
ncbi:MAG: hypothetical protein V4525_08055 [Pseudomonadota bacterium]